MLKTDRLQKNIRIYICTVLALLLVTMSSIAMAANNTIWVEVNHSYLYQAGSSPITRVAVANPAIADVIVLDNAKINIIGRAVGSTDISVWSANGMRQDFIISITNTDTATADLIKQTIGSPGLKVAKVGEKLILQGVVENQHELENAVGLANAYVGEGNVINLVKMKNPTMVNLAAVVLEISSSDALRYGLQYGNSTDASTLGSGSPNITFGTAGTFYGGQNVHDLTGGTYFQNVDFMLQALQDEGKAKILSRPNITTMSGEEAEIQIGGEIGIKSTGSNGSSDVSWKNYGIMLKIKPTVDHENKVTTKVNAEVSTLDWTNAVDGVPALSNRKANTMVTIPTGGTMSIGGLMNNSDSKSISKVPILGDIPIIGEFFKHTVNSKDKRELMILVTPTVVTINDPVKGTNQMLNHVEGYKRDFENLENIYPNDPPMPVEDEFEEVEDVKDEGPLFRKRDTTRYQSWTEKAEAEMRAEAAASAAANYHAPI